MTRFIISTLIALLVSGPAWALKDQTYGKGIECQRRSKSTPLAGVKMHRLMRFSPALAVVPVVHRRDPRCFV